MFGMCLHHYSLQKRGLLPKGKLFLVGSEKKQLRCENRGKTVVEMPGVSTFQQGLVVLCKFFSPGHSQL